MPIRKLEKKIDRSDYQFEKDFQGKISIHDFKLLKKIAEGAYGAVYLVQMKETEEYFAMKVIDYIQGFKHSQTQILGEQEMFRCLSGKFIVNPLYIFTYNEFMCFVMEFMGGGDLASVLEEWTYFDEFIVRFYITEMILATHHLHQQNIIHRDLKPENVLLDNTGHLKLTDFGLATFINRKQKKRRSGKNKFSIQGTPDYISPEVLQGETPGKMCDWWSIGIILYEMLVSMPPFNAKTRSQVYDNILTQEIEWPPIGDEEGEMSKEAQDIIIQFLVKDPTKRLGYNGGLKEIKKHPFFQKEDTHSWDNIFQMIAPFKFRCQQIKGPGDLSLFDRETNTKDKHANFIQKVEEDDTDEQEYTPEGKIDNLQRFDNLDYLNQYHADKLLNEKTNKISSDI